jgi:hypothetical protein
MDRYKRLAVTVGFIIVALVFTGLAIGGLRDFSRVLRKERENAKPASNRISYGWGYSIYRVEYESRVYLVNPNGGIIEHIPGTNVLH